MSLSAACQQPASSARLRGLGGSGVRVLHVVACAQRQGAAAGDGEQQRRGGGGGGGSGCASLSRA